MKRVLIAGVLGGLLLLGTPTTASSNEKDDRRSEKSADHKGDRDKGDRGDKAHRGDRDHRGDHDGRHRYGRHRHYRHGGYYYGGGYRHHPYYGGGYGRHPYYGGYYDPYNPYGPGYSSGPRQGQVIVSGMSFHPSEVHSPAGEPVLWLFQDGDIPHTVTADNGSFDSGNKVNDEYQLRFHHPGTYSYHCAIHPEMKGRVIVH